MINFDENKKGHNSNWPHIPDQSYKFSIIGGSGSGKTNALSNLINHQPDSDKIYLDEKYLFEAKYQYLINKREKVDLKHYDDPKTFITYSNDLQDVYKDIEEYNPVNKRKVLIVFGEMIADMISNKKFNPVTTELFIRGRKPNISIVFKMQSFFRVPKEARLITRHFLL